MSQRRRSPDCARGLLLLLLAVPAAVFALAGCLDEPNADRFAPKTSSTTRAVARPPQPLLVEGEGPVTRMLRLDGEGPLVVRARVRGRDRFVATIRSTRYELLLFETSAPFHDVAAVPAPGPGPIQLEVETSGSWSLLVERPVPDPGDTRLPGLVSGRRSAAVPVQVPDEPPHAVLVSHGGRGRFVAHLLPYEDFAMGIEIVARKGTFEQRVSLTEALRGPYLLVVTAGGPWALRFLAD